MRRGIVGFVVLVAIAVGAPAIVQAGPLDCASSFTSTHLCFGTMTEATAGARLQLDGTTIEVTAERVDRSSVLIHDGIPETVETSSASVTVVRTIDGTESRCTGSIPAAAFTMDALASEAAVHAADVCGIELSWTGTDEAGYSGGVGGLNPSRDEYGADYEHADRHRIARYATIAGTIGGVDVAGGTLEWAYLLRRDSVVAVAQNMPDPLG